MRIDHGNAADESFLGQSRYIDDPLDGRVEVADVVFDDGDFDIDGVELDDFCNGVALHEPLANFGVLGGDPAVERSFHGVAVELLFEAGKLGLLRGDAGAGLLGF